MTCYSLEKLLEFHQELCAEKEARAIREHLGRCRRCQQESTWLQTVISLMATDDSVEPPAEVVQRALDLFAHYGPSPQPGRLERIIAALVFDTATQPGLVGVRSLGMTTRQCLYRWEGYDIDLAVEPATDRVMLTGQILGPSDSFQEVSGVPVQLRKAEDVIAETVTNALGEFTFEGVAVGVYELKVELQGKEVWISPLDLKALTE